MFWTTHYFLTPYILSCTWIQGCLGCYREDFWTEWTVWPDTCYVLIHSIQICVCLRNYTWIQMKLERWSISLCHFGSISSTILFLAPSLLPLICNKSSCFHTSFFSIINVFIEPPVHSFLNSVYQSCCLAYIHSEAPSIYREGPGSALVWSARLAQPWLLLFCLHCLVHLSVTESCCFMAPSFTHTASPCGHLSVCPWKPSSDFIFFGTPSLMVPDI